MSDLSNMCLDYLRKGHAPQANELAMRAVKATPNDWHARYALGQCFQTAGQWVQAAAEYALADRLHPNDKVLLLALGIARQKERRFDLSKTALEQALVVDPDYEFAHNSLGMTLKAAGDNEAALAAYDAGLAAIARKTAIALQNNIAGPRYAYRISRNGLWLAQVKIGAAFLCRRDQMHLDPIMPSTEEFERDAKTAEFRGAMWSDYKNQMGLSGRKFTPNFVNGMFQGFANSGTYSTLVRNKGGALQAMGRGDEARAHDHEADDFA